MNAIVCVDKKWGIGKNNGLLFSLPEDMQFFRKTTLNTVVCMGYNTLLSFPNSKPLKNRVNIVLAPDGVERDDCTVVHTLDELSKQLKKYQGQEIFVIGGAMFYRTMLPYCEKVYVTKVDADGEATVFYENLDNLDNWEMVECGDEVVSGDYKIRFTVYKNSAVKEF